ncbi:MAG: transporter, family, methylenomycin resistance protein [Pseudonocardiales bacterium]|nr:transporter, family, methylenomycin resistance protein [Pseudonocardiales bacterium]
MTSPPSTLSDVSAPHPGERVRSGRVLACACLGYGVIVVDITIVNLAIPAMQLSLHAGLAAMQLVVNAYVIVLAALVLAGAAAGDRWGAVTMFRTGVTVFGLASVLCGAAPNVELLIGARVLQGLGAILLMPATLVMLTRAYPEPDRRAKAIAVWAMVAGSPVVFGPLLGGALVDLVGWRAIFLINIPLVIATLLLARRQMPPQRHGTAAPQDFPGQILAAAMLGGVAVALTYGHELGWQRALPLCAAGIAVAATGGFVWRQRTATHPLLPPALLRAPGFVAYAVVGLLLFAGYYGLVFAISVFLQQVRDYGPFVSGLCFLPSAVPITVMPLVAGRVNARLGAPVVLRLAIAATATGALLLVLVGQLVPFGLAAGLFAIGVGFGLATVPQVTLLMAAAPAEWASTASGILTVGRQTGTILGITVFGGLRTGDSIRLPALGALAGYGLMAVAAAVGGVQLARRARADRTAPDPAGALS